MHVQRLVFGPVSEPIVNCLPTDSRWRCSIPPLTPRLKDEENGVEGIIIGQFAGSSHGRPVWRAGVGVISFFFNHLEVVAKDCLVDG
jgi:hypothetical protein